MDRGVGAAIEDRLLHLAHEHALSADRVERDVTADVTRGLDEHELDLERVHPSQQVGDMTRLQLCRQLRALAATRAVPLFALSADALPEQIAVAMANGFALYLTKPVNQRELLLVLDGVAEGAEPAAVA